MYSYAVVIHKPDVSPSAALDHLFRRYQHIVTARDRYCVKMGKFTCVTFERYLTPYRSSLSYAFAGYKADMFGNGFNSIRHAMSIGDTMEDAHARMHITTTFRKLTGSIYQENGIIGTDTPDAEAEAFLKDLVSWAWRCVPTPEAERVSRPRWIVATASAEIGYIADYIRDTECFDFNVPGSSFRNLYYASPCDHRQILVVGNSTDCREFMRFATISQQEEVSGGIMYHLEDDTASNMLSYMAIMERHYDLSK
ncbi:hypothetical protein [Clostridium sp.]|uniref:hypothetical protein n=1 Tax=Clostridium sp. TaxID=1506 RepID=UPI003F66AA0A